MWRFLRTPTLITLLMWGVALACNPLPSFSERVAENGWVIIEIVPNSPNESAPDVIGVEMSFSNGGVRGQGKCNSIGGFYEMDEMGQVTRAEVHMTLVGCDPEALHEQRLVRYLTYSEHLYFEGGNLVVQSQLGQIYFEPGEALEK